MSDLSPIPPCPLCQCSRGRLFHRDTREFYRCPVCHLVFVPPHQHLPRHEEKSEYDLHQNSPRDPGYRRFLGRLLVPLCDRLPPCSRGLDFGSGPGPTLSVMFEEAGHSMRIYDPFYAPDTAPLRETYDFISSSEVVEHLFHPGPVLDQLWSRLRSGGWLGIMTKRVIDQKAFARWHYKNDRTHVCFFSLESFHWLASRWSAEVLFPETDIALLRKSPTVESR